MSATIELKGMDEVRALIAGIGGELHEASGKAQNKMAYQLMEAEKLQMQADLDRPVAWSVGALRYKKAYEAGGSGAPVVEGAAVYMANLFTVGDRVDADQYLGVQVVAGDTAGPRRSEKRLQALGVLAADHVWAPAKGVKLDSHGNIPGGVFTSMLTDFGLNPYAQTKDKNFCLIGRPPVGVLTRIGDAWFPFLHFIPRAKYGSRWDFYGRADREVAMSFKAIMDEYLVKALEHMR
jgi:hypothetical protein